MIHKILAELNESNSSNHKLSVLKKYKDNEILKLVLEMTYDRVKYTYGMTRKQVLKFEPQELNNPYDLECALSSMIDNFTTRKITGHKALQMMSNLVYGLSKEDGELLLKILDRDLRINIGKTQINKVWKNLITKPAYCRCDTYSKKTSKNINFPALVQLKADGLAVFTKITENEVICYTRSGNEFKLDSLQYLTDNKDLSGYIIQGEFLIQNENDRALGNGLINSLIKYKQGTNASLKESEAKEIENKIVYQIWDLISSEDMQKALNREKDGTIYKNRFDKLKSIFK